MLISALAVLLCLGLVAFGVRVIMEGDRCVAQEPDKAHTVRTNQVFLVGFGGIIAMMMFILLGVAFAPRAPILDWCGLVCHAPCAACRCLGRLGVQEVQDELRRWGRALWTLSGVLVLASFCFLNAFLTFKMKNWFEFGVLYFAFRLLNCFLHWDCGRLADSWRAWTLTKSSPRPLIFSASQNQKRSVMKFASTVGAKKALPKLKQLKNTAAMGSIGADGKSSEACATGPTCLYTQVGCNPGLSQPCAN